MRYVFDGCTIDTRLYTLQREEQPAHLRPKVFQMLLYLLEHGDRVVSKQELAEQIWPDQFIADSTLESTIRGIRQGVGDSGREQRVIRTIPGHGYRFVARITEVVEDGDTSPLSVESAPPPATPAHEPPGMEAPDTPDTWQCPACQHVNHATNPEHDRFCIACGTSRSPRCAHCGAEHLSEAKFCAACGAQLLAPSVPPVVPQPDSPSAAEAERRQLTVMSCALADTSILAEQLDLEDFHDIIRRYQETCAEVIQRFDGYIAQNLVEGLLVYFGYPQAHEDDAQRAVRVGLGMLEALAALNTRLAPHQGARLSMRLGIHTGPVIVGGFGSQGRQEMLALGETPNMAAWIQRTAAPDTVVISAATSHLIQGYFACQDLASQTLEGVGATVHLARVIGVSSAQSRLDVAKTSGLTPLVGREAEVALLLDRWAQVKEGFGQVVILSGESGVGKSRLARALRDHLVEESYIKLECRCSPYHQNSALYPVIDLLQYACQWQPRDTPDEKRIKLETTLAQYGVCLDEQMPLVADLLSLPLTADQYAPLQLLPQRQRDKTLEAILAMLAALASRQPVLLFVDDLHWIDPSSQELLSLLVDQIPTTSICIVLTCRPTFQAPWSPRSYLTQMTLARLPRRQIEQMITHIIGRKAFPTEVMQSLVARTDGVPLFAEELTKTVLEIALLREADDHYELAAPLLDLAIPATLHDSLMARLDRLGGAKGVAQLGATLGRQFTYELLHAVSPWDEATLQRGLGRLVEAELLYQQGLPSQVTYVFKHALIQETAYQSLVRSTRQHYHQRIAEVLVTQFPDLVETQPELLAHHYTEAGLIEQAIDSWQRAGQHAIERSANVEAIRHLTKGLELLGTLPSTPETLQQELTLQLTLGAPLLMIKGQTALEVEALYARARELSEQTGKNSQLFSALMGLWRSSIARAQLPTARELGEQCFMLAQRIQAPAFLQEAHMMLGTTLLYLGELAAARRHLEQGMALYDPQQSRSRTFSSGTDPGVAGLSRIAWVLWELGYPEQALTSSQQALELAQESSHAFSSAFALFFAATLRFYRREAPQALELSETAIALSQEHGFVLWLGGGMIVRGWALATLGSHEEGAQQLLQGLDMWRDIGAEIGQPYFLAMLAEVHGQEGRTEEGLRRLSEALSIAHRNDERCYEAELHRLKGELLLQQSAERGGIPGLVKEAEACLLQALDLARSQQAKSLAIRAAMSLSRLWQAQGEYAQARLTLADLYTWFTEGFETPDLQEAKALLEALA